MSSPCSCGPGSARCWSRWLCMADCCWRTRAPCPCPCPCPRTRRRACRWGWSSWSRRGTGSPRTPPEVLQTPGTPWGRGEEDGEEPRHRVTWYTYTHLYIHTHTRNRNTSMQTHTPIQRQGCEHSHAHTHAKIKHTQADADGAHTHTHVISGLDDQIGRAHV